MKKTKWYNGATHVPGQTGMYQIIVRKYGDGFDKYSDPFIAVWTGTMWHLAKTGLEIMPYQWRGLVESPYKRKDRSTMQQAYFH